MPKGLWNSFENELPWQCKYAAKLGDVHRNKLEISLGTLRINLSKSYNLKGSVIAVEILIDPVLLNKRKKPTSFATPTVALVDRHACAFGWCRQLSYHSVGQASCSGCDHLLCSCASGHRLPLRCHRRLAKPSRNRRGACTTSASGSLLFLLLACPLAPLDQCRCCQQRVSFLALRCPRSDEESAAQSTSSAYSAVAPMRSTRSQ